MRNQMIVFTYNFLLQKMLKMRFTNIGQAIQNKVALLGASCHHQGNRWFYNIMNRAYLQQDFNKWLIKTLWEWRPIIEWKRFQLSFWWWTCLNILMKGWLCIDFLGSRSIKLTWGFDEICMSKTFDCICFFDETSMTVNIP